MTELNEICDVQKERTEEPSKKASTRAKRAGFRLHSDKISHDQVPDVGGEIRRQGSDFSKPVLLKKLCLKSSQAQKEFEHCYVRVDYSLYIATKAFREQWRLKEARQAEKLYNEIFGKFEGELNTAREELQRVINERVNEEDQQLIFDHVREQIVPLRTGYSSKLIQLTVMLDTIIGLLEVLEINNVLTCEEASKGIRSWCARYRQFCSTINRARFSFSRS